jgi:hypothetical protein
MRSLSAYQADPEIVFIDRSARVPAIERTYKVIHVVPNRLFGADLQDGILVSVPERIVIEAAVWWQNAGDLREPDHWLSRVVQVLDAELVRDLLARMNASVAARTAYLIDRFGRADLAEAIGPEQFAGVAWIGRRDAGGARFHPKWRVYDSVGVAEP